jgi:hypothetical protein
LRKNLQAHRENGDFISPILLFQNEIWAKSVKIDLRLNPCKKKRMQGNLNNVTNTFPKCSSRGC